MFKNAFACVSLIAIIASAPTRVHGWGCDGHQIVAQIARKQLNATALDQADKLLRNDPIDNGLIRFCGSNNLSRFVDASTWADDVRETTTFSHTRSWHFIDIPRADTSGNVGASCPTEGCVTKAITDEIATLKSTSASGTEKANALRFLIHFMGDIHQPLHCADNNDRGGNCVMVKRVTSSSTTKKKLHSVWDTAFVQQVMAGRTVKTTATSLSNEFSSEISTWKSAGVNLDAWALESHKLAEDVTYGKLPTAIPVEAPAHPPIETCPVPAKPTISLNAAYRKASKDAIAPQLAKAGSRLAMVLNDVWP